MAADASEKQRLRACERVLLDHMEEFVKVGLALKEIRDERLYEADGHTDFKAYLKDRNEFGYSRRHAYQLIEAAELRMVLPTCTTESRTSWTARSVRELKRLPTDSKAKAVAAAVIKHVTADRTGRARGPAGTIRETESNVSP